MFLIYDIIFMVIYMKKIISISFFMLISILLLTGCEDKKNLGIKFNINGNECMKKDKECEENKYGPECKTCKEIGSS